jgi:hypothetical protein
MSKDAGCFWGVLPRAQRAVRRVSYYIEVAGTDGPRRTPERTMAVVSDARQCTGARVAPISPVDPAFVGATANAPLAAAGFGDTGGGSGLLLVAGGALAVGGGAALALGGGGGSEAARVPSATPTAPSFETPAATPTASPTPTPSPTRLPGATATATTAATATPQLTTRPRATATTGPTPTVTPTVRATSTATATSPGATPTSRATATPTATATATGTASATPTPTAAATATPTTPPATATPSPTAGSGAPVNTQEHRIVSWRSELAAAPGSARVFVNDALLVEAPAGVHEGRFLARSGQNTVVLESLTTGAGEWRLSMGGPGVADGSFVPLGGPVTVSGSVAVVRLSGRPGERAFLRFRSR